MSKINNTVKALIDVSASGVLIEDTDWHELLEIAVDSVDINLAEMACYKLGKEIERDIFEKILLNAVVLGNFDTAKRACEKLGRNFDEAERRIITETSVLSGNLTGLLENLHVPHITSKSLLHTCAIIAVCRAMRKHEGKSLPTVINLNTWVKVYAREISRLSLFDERHFYITTPCKGVLYLLSKKSLLIISGALLAFSLANTKQVNALF